MLGQEDEPTAGFALSGVDKRLETLPGLANLESLGCLSFQPFWLFVREGSAIDSTRGLVGQTVALGQSETDVRAIATLALFRLRFKLQLLGIYKRIEMLEDNLMATADWNQAMEGLREIQNEVAALKVPRFAVTQYLELRQNVHDLRERLETWREDYPEVSPASSESP